MVTFINTTQEIVYINALAVDNNMPGVIASLRASGFIVPDNVTRDELLDKLWLIFNTDKSLWISVISRVPYNASAANYTTSDEVVNMIYNAETSNGARFNIGNFFKDVAAFIGGSTTTSTTTTDAKGNALIGGFAILTIVGVAITIIVMLFKK